MKKVPKKDRKEVTEQIGLAIIDSIGEYLDKGSTPVSNGEFKRSLSPKYKDKTGKRFSDLDLTGDMLGSLTLENTANKVTLKITDPTQKKKAFNHNVGDTLPARQFLPDDLKGEKFKRSITKRIKDIINDASEN